MRTLIVCLAALTCWASPVFAKERSFTLEHELSRRTPLEAPAKASEAARAETPAAETPAVQAPEPARPAVEKAEAAPAQQPEQSAAPVAAQGPEQGAAQEPVSPPASASAGAPSADPAPAVDDAMREADVKLAPPDEQKAIDFALTPFENGRTGAPTEPAAKGEPALETAPAPGAPDSGKPSQEPSKETPTETPQETAPSAPATDSRAPDKLDSQGASEHSPTNASPSQAAASFAEPGLGDDECAVLGAVVRCDQANAVLAGLLKAPDDFDHPGSMQMGRETASSSGGKSETRADIGLAVKVDGKVPDAQARISEAQRGRSARLSAKLAGEGFAIEPEGLQERAAQPGQDIRWTWTAAPLASGPGKSLKLELYAHSVDRNGERAPVLVRTWETGIDVRAAPQAAVQGKASVPDKLMGLAGGGADPMVYGASAALAAALATALALVMRGRSSRSGSRGDPGDVLGDLRETTGAPKPFKVTPGNPGQDGGGFA